ncbi:hypothetical protein LO762_09535 [Actinocorallia sp. API 0066]|uniref:hypothetical protein n=1 Tax=Actinocorallia sp. API 0066 TaxID=2896846 RepID=UPI001E458290|nr:hypothetical protein [Actinocorallia sp. API 0066]MCD0449429.1 hypothetical protein [Actinocorallia sp. API 0066]
MSPEAAHGHAYGSPPGELVAAYKPHEKTIVATLDKSHVNEDSLPPHVLALLDDYHTKDFSEPGL